MLEKKKSEYMELRDRYDYRGDATTQYQLQSVRNHIEALEWVLQI